MSAEGPNHDVELVGENHVEQHQVEQHPVAAPQVIDMRMFVMDTWRMMFLERDLRQAQLSEDAVKEERDQELGEILEDIARFSRELQAEQNE